METRTTIIDAMNAHIDAQAAKSNTLNPEQEKAVNDCREWLTTVYNMQNKWLSEADLWTAYPFKRTGMNQHGFNVILKALKTICP